MEDYTSLVKELRFATEHGCEYDLIARAADAIEELQAKVEELRQDNILLTGQVYELNEQLPKRGEIVRCGECKHGSQCLLDRIQCKVYDRIHAADWFCAGGERKEVQA